MNVCIRPRSKILDTLQVINTLSSTDMLRSSQLWQREGAQAKPALQHTLSTRTPCPICQITKMKLVLNVNHVFPRRTEN